MEDELLVSMCPFDPAFLVVVITDPDNALILPAFEHQTTGGKHYGHECDLTAKGQG